MNPSLIDWFQLLAILAVEIGVIVGVAFLAQSRMASGPWRRTVWQTCFLALALLLGCKLAGFADPLTNWVRPSHPSFDSANSSPSLTDAFREEVARRQWEIEASNADQPHAVGGQSRLGGEHAMVGFPALGAAQVLPTIPPPAVGTQPSIPEPTHVRAPVMWPAWIWLAGILAMLARWMARRRSLWNFLRHSRPVMNSELHDQVLSLQSMLGLRRQVRLKESDLLQSPIAHGWLRPTIVLPAGFGDAHSLAQQQVMLIHELTHLLARDSWWYGLSGCLRSLVWWHPCVWMAWRQLRSASERAADEASLLVANGPGVLAECLVAMGSQLTRPRLSAGISIEGNRFKSSLGQRVARLLSLTGHPWAPPGRVQSWVVKTFLPLLLVVFVLITTAWAAPQPYLKGQTAMKSIRQSWKQFLAAASLGTLLSGDAADAAAPPRTATEAASPAASPAPPLVAVPQALPVLAPPPAAPKVRAGNVPGELPPPPSRPGSPALPPPSGLGASGKTYSALSEEKAAIQRKLRETIFPEVAWDGIPLVDIIKQLNEEARKRDPRGEGLNFVLNEQVPNNQAQALDPATGLPIAAPEILELGTAIVRIVPPVRNVRLVDVLDIIRTIADQPIDYTVEDYGIVFARRPNHDANPQETLMVRTFHVDAELLFQGMESAFGIGPPSDPVKALPLSPVVQADIAILEENLKYAQGEFERASELMKQNLIGESELRKVEHQMRMAKLNLDKEHQRQAQRPGRAIQPQLFRELFLQLGIRLDPPKSVFYNEHTGIVMVRVAPEEMNLVEAAIETLGGSNAASAVRTERSAAGLGGYGGATFVPAKQ